ncbi:MAG: outer membrane protein assembly factor BamD, partial [bacterium]
MIFSFFISTLRFFPRAMAKILLTIVLLLSVGGCAYFNYYYNAQKYYRQAEKQERDAQKEGRSFTGGSSLYEKAIESAGKLLLYYPESRWEDDALLLIAKAYFKTARYRSAITKIEELELKYPQSSLLSEGYLVKGLSYFKVAESDSGIVLLQTLISTRSEPQILSRAYQALGDHYLKEKNFDQAWVCYRKASELAPLKEDKIEIMLQEGIALTLLGRHREAVDLYDKILKERLS